MLVPASLAVKLSFFQFLVQYCPHYHPPTNVYNPVHNHYDKLVDGPQLLVTTGAFAEHGIIAHSATAGCQNGLRYEDKRQPLQLEEARMREDGSGEENAMN